MDAILETKKIMRNAIKTYAEKRQSEITNTQIKIYTESEKATPKYKILNSFNDDFSEEITLKQLMLIPSLDWTGKSMKLLVVEPAIKNILKRLSKEQNKNVQSISVFVATNDITAEQLKLILCIDDKPLKRLRFTDILD